MDIKDLLKRAAKVYFIIATLICFAMYIIGALSFPEAKLGYEAFSAPLLYALFGVVPVIIMHSRKELSVKQFIIRKMIQLISIEILIFVALLGGDYLPLTFPVAAGLFFLVALIFVLEHVIEFLLDSKRAADLTKDLEDYQKRS